MYKRHLAFSEASERRNHSEVLYLNLSKKTITCLVAKPLVINISELPIIGNLHQFATKEAVENAHLVTKQWFDQYGPVIKIRQVIPSKMGDILRLLEGG